MKNITAFYFFSLIFFTGFSQSKELALEEYEVINEVISPFEKNIPIPLDSIFLNNKFIVLGVNHFKAENINEETFKFLWNNGDIKGQPPIELFFKNFNLSHLKSDIIKSQSDSIINFKSLKGYFHSSNEAFIKNNPKHKYLSISKPFFNCNKDWCFIVKSQYIPYTSTGGNGVMYIYVKVDDLWVLYNTIDLWLT